MPLPTLDMITHELEASLEALSFAPYTYFRGRVTAYCPREAA